VTLNSHLPKISLFILLLVLLTILNSCSFSPVKAEEKAQVGMVEIGIASWYGAEFHGRRTSNGEIYDMYQLTAAHRSFPFGTIVRVTNLGNGKIVMVRINNRGPFIKRRIIDLSYAAAVQLDMVEQGIAEVRIEVVQTKD